MRSIAVVCGTMPPTSAGILLAALLVGPMGSRPLSAQEKPTYQNLQVLPADIGRSELNRIMLDNLQGLGLRRRANEGCLFCHVGSMEVPPSQWDWASDEKPMKIKARAMMAMVQDINEEHLARIERTSDRDVGCYTCHAARTNPMPLSELLLREYEEGGLDAVIESYRSLRTRYFGADAYDFRVPVLAAVASEVGDRELGAAESDDAADREPLEDAAAIHRLNIEYTGEPAAHWGLIRLRMMEALETDGIEGMIERYEELRAEHPPEAYHPLLLDGLGWRIFRSGRQETAMHLFELNYREHPEAFATTESLAWASSSMGQPARAVEIAREWLTSHPDHELGQRLLRDLEGR